MIILHKELTCVIFMILQLLFNKVGAYKLIHILLSQATNGTILIKILD